jgi:hypothetical protein
VQNIISTDPSRTDDVVVQLPLEGRLSFEIKSRVLSKIRQGQLDAFKILREKIHALLATGYRPTPALQSFECLKGLLDPPIIGVRMDELYELDEDDRCSFCCLKYIPAAPQISYLCARM